MMVIFLRAPQLVLVVLLVTIICEASETTERCNKRDTSRCFVEKIEKSRHKIKHMIQLKSSDVPLVSMYLYSIQDILYIFIWLYEDCVVVSVL